MAENIALQDQINEDDILLIKTNALFHDGAFIITRIEGQVEQCFRFAIKKLPAFGYTKKKN